MYLYKVSTGFGSVLCDSSSFYRDREEIENGLFTFLRYALKRRKKGKGHLESEGNHKDKVGERE